MQPSLRMIDVESVAVVLVLQDVAGKLFWQQWRRLALTKRSTDKRGR